MKFFKKASHTQWVTVLTVAAVVGLLSGIVGQLFATAFLDPYEYYLSRTYTHDTAELLPELNRVKRLIGIEQNFEINRLSEAVLPTVVGIHRHQAQTGGPIQSAYTMETQLGSGAILTNDGWIVTHKDVIDSLTAAQLAVTSRGQVFVVKALYTDPATGVVFLKIESNNLPVVVLGDSEESFVGQLVAAVSGGHETITAGIASQSQGLVAKEDLLFSSEVFTSQMALDEVLPAGFVGGPVFNIAGEYIGMVLDSSSGKIVPINYFQPVLADILRNQVVRRPVLGVEYIDLASAPGASQLATTGALITRVASRSAAASAGVLVNDIVVSVDGESLGGSKTLTEVIQQYKPGDAVSVEIIRATQRRTIVITLQ